MAIVVAPVNTIPVTDFIREVMPFLPGVPEFEAEYRLKQAMREFCQRSKIWRQRNTTMVTTVLGQQEYPAGLPSGVELAGIVSAWMGGTELGIMFPGDEDNIPPGETADTPDIGVINFDTVILSALPQAAGVAVVGTIALAPNEASTTCPAFLFDRWRDAIRDGCLARVMLQVGKPWSNPGQGVMHAVQFDDDCREASNAAGPVRRVSLRTVGV